jgi:hypothetical protein
MTSLDLDRIEVLSSNNRYRQTWFFRFEAVHIEDTDTVVTSAEKDRTSHRTYGFFSQLRGFSESIPGDFLWLRGFWGRDNSNLPPTSLAVDTYTRKLFSL